MFNNDHPGRERKPPVLDQATSSAPDAKHQDVCYCRCGRLLARTPGTLRVPTIPSREFHKLFVDPDHPGRAHPGPLRPGLLRSEPWSSLSSMFTSARGSTSTPSSFRPVSRTSRYTTITTLPHNIEDDDGIEDDLEDMAPFLWFGYFALALFLLFIVVVVVMVVPDFVMAGAYIFFKLAQIKKRW